MELIKNLFDKKGYIDGITIIDINGEILFSVKFKKLQNNKSDIIIPNVKMNNFLFE